MSAYRYLNKICQGWQRKTFIRLSAVCPYCFDHRKLKLHQPEFVRQGWFNFYSSGHRKQGRRVRNLKRGGSEYRHGKLYKLYWHLHNEQTPKISPDY